MTDVLQATFPNAFQRKCILVENLLKGIPKGPNDNKLTSPRVMVCDKTVQMSVRWYSNRAQHEKEMYLARWSLRDTYRGVRFINTLRPRQNGRHFPDDIFKCIFLNENVLISIKISLKFVPKGQLNNIPALVQTMAWRRPGDKPLSEPMMVILLTHICVTRPQWVNRHIIGSDNGSFGAQPFPEPVLIDLLTHCGWVSQTQLMINKHWFR